MEARRRRCAQEAGSVAPAVLGVIQLPVGDISSCSGLPPLPQKLAVIAKGDIAGRMEGQLADFLLNPRAV